MEQLEFGGKQPQPDEAQRLVERLTALVAEVEAVC
jgi:hypothetical protein